MSTGAPWQPGFTIEELADMVDMTPRNIRAHQARGLLMPPRVAGRIGYYDGHHVARLRLIKQLQALGFNLSAIEYILRDTSMLAAVLQERRGQASSTETSPYVPMSADAIDCIRGLRESMVHELMTYGLLRLRADGTYVAHAVLVAAGTALLDRGVPVDLVTRLQAEAAQVAHRLAGESATRLCPGTGKPPDPEDVAEVQLLLVQLVTSAFEGAFAHRLEGLATSAQPHNDAD
jgi:DNA-binding transcriptional MerR regulator